VFFFFFFKKYSLLQFRAYMAPSNIIFVTGNPYKLEHLRKLLGHVVKVESLKLDIPEIQGTVEEIAKDKCRRAAKIVRDQCFSRISI